MYRSWARPAQEEVDPITIGISDQNRAGLLILSFDIMTALLRSRSYLPSILMAKYSSSCLESWDKSSVCSSRPFRILAGEFDPNADCVESIISTTVCSTIEFAKHFVAANSFVE
jgi:hypothetical protein